MARLFIDQQKLAFLVRKLGSTAAAVRAAKQVAVIRGGYEIQKAITANMSIPMIGGTPKRHATALAQMDHPYARRHRRIRLRPTGGYPGFKHPELAIHSVSGRLRSAIRGKFNPRDDAWELDIRDVPHARFVFQGTRVMLPRDLLGATVDDPAVRDAVRKVVVDTFGRQFRTQAAIRFTS